MHTKLVSEPVYTYIKLLVAKKMIRTFEQMAMTGASPVPFLISYLSMITNKFYFVCEK